MLPPELSCVSTEVSLLWTESETWKWVIVGVGGWMLVRM